MNKVFTNFKAGKRDKSKPLWIRKHMDAVAEQCCIITGRSDNVKLHHPYHDRQTEYGGQKAPDLHVIPLWQGIHQGLLGHKEIRVHGEKQQWRELHGPDHSYVKKVRLIVYGDETMTDEEIEEYWSKQ